MADNVVDIVIRTVDEATGELQSIARGIADLGSSIASNLQGSVASLSVAPIEQGLEAARTQADGLDAAMTNIGRGIDAIAGANVDSGLEEAVDTAETLQGEIEGAAGALAALDTKPVTLGGAAGQAKAATHAIARAKSETDKLAHSAKTTESHFAKLGTSLDRLGRNALGVGAGLVGIFGLRAFVENIVEAEQATVRLDFAFEKMGRAAGLTRNQLDGLIEGLKHVTTATGSQLKEAAATLLRFDQITGTTFERVLRLAPDVAVALGSDIPSAAQLMGRALQQPAERLGLLSRLGVALSPSLEKAIDRMIELGQTSRAQAILLREMESSIGGLSERMRNTLGGSLSVLGAQIRSLFKGDSSDFGTAIGSLDALTTKLADPKLKEGMDALIAGFVTLGGKAIEGAALLGQFGAAYGELAGRFVAGSDQVLQRINENLAANVAEQEKLAGRVKTLRNELDSLGGRALNTVSGGRTDKFLQDLIDTNLAAIAKLKVEEAQLVRGRTQELLEQQRNWAAVEAAAKAAAKAKEEAANAGQGTGNDDLSGLGELLTEINITAERLGESGVDALRKIDEQIREKTRTEIQQLVEEWKRSAAEIEAAAITPRIETQPLEHFDRVTGKLLAQFEVPRTLLIDTEQAERALEELTDKFLEPLKIEVERVTLPPVPERELSAFGKRAAENIQDAIADGLRSIGSGEGKSVALRFLEAFRETFIQAGAAKLAKLFKIEELLSEPSPAAQTQQAIRRGTVAEAEATVAQVLGTVPAATPATRPTTSTSTQAAAIPAGTVPASPEVTVPPELTRALERAPPDVSLAVPPELTQALERNGECCPTEALAALNEHTTEIRDSVVEDTARVETAVKEVSAVLRETTMVTDRSAASALTREVSEADRSAEHIADVLRESTDTVSADESRSTERLERVAVETARTSTIERDAASSDIAREVIRATAVERDSSATVERDTTREVLRDPAGFPIDTTRPALQNADGSRSTEETITVEFDERFFNIPTIVGGERVNDDAAMLDALRRLAEGESIPNFATQAEAARQAPLRSEAIGAAREVAAAFEQHEQETGSEIAATIERAVLQPEALPFHAIDALAEELSKNPVLSQADPRDTAAALGTAPSESAAQLASSIAPVLGDISGLLQDVTTFATDAESRTAGNVALSAAGILPFVPNVSAVRKSANQYTKYGRDRFGPAAMTAEEARAAGYTEGPFYHSTDFAAEIEQGGFKQRAMETWEIRDYGTMEEVRKWGTGLNPVMFADRIEDVVETAAHNAYGKEALTLFARPGSVQSADGLTLAGGRFVRDPADVVPILGSRQPARAGVAEQLQRVPSSTPVGASLALALGAGAVTPESSATHLSEAISSQTQAIEEIVVEASRETAAQQTVSAELASEIARSVESATAEVHVSVERELSRVAETIRETVARADAPRPDLSGSAPAPIPPRDEGPFPGESPELPDAEVAAAISASTTTTTTTIERSADATATTVAEAIRESTTQLSEVIRENNQQTSVLGQTVERAVLQQGSNVTTVERSTVERGPIEQADAGQALEEIRIDAQPIAEAMTQAVDKLPPVFDRAIGGLGKLVAHSAGQLGGLVTAAVAAIQALAAGQSASGAMGAAGAASAGGIWGVIGTAIGSILGFAEGGLIDGQKLAEGGLVRGPGTGTSDSIPAVVRETGRRVQLSNKEFVTPAAVVAKPGVLPALEALRQGTPLREVAAAVLGVGEASQKRPPSPPLSGAGGRTVSGLPGDVGIPDSVQRIVGALLPGRRMATGGLVGGALASIGLASTAFATPHLDANQSVPLGLAAGGLVGTAGIPLSGLAAGGLVSDTTGGVMGSLVQQASASNTFEGSTYHVEFNGSGGREEQQAMWVQFMAWAERRDRDTERRIMERMRVTGFGRLR